MPLPLRLIRTERLVLRAVVDSHFESSGRYDVGFWVVHLAALYYLWQSIAF